MPISDWISDVCSSVLAHHGVEGEGTGQRPVGDLIENHVVRVRQQHAQELARVLGTEAKDIEAEFREARQPTPVRALDARRRLQRSDERRAGKACVSTCRSRGSPYN